MDDAANELARPCGRRLPGDESNFRGLEWRCAITADLAREARRRFGDDAQAAGWLDGLAADAEEQLRQRRRGLRPVGGVWEIHAWQWPSRFGQLDADTEWTVSVPALGTHTHVAARADVKAAALELIAVTTGLPLRQERARVVGTTERAVLVVGLAHRAAELDGPLQADELALIVEAARAGRVPS